MKFGYGIDLGGTTVKLAYFNDQGVMLSKWEIPTVKTDSGKQILPDISASIKEHMANNGLHNDQILGIGIGVPGPVNAEGEVIGCVNLGWGVLNVEKALSDLTGLPVKAGNDANVAALGECWKGGGQGSKNIIFATLGTGVGGGIVLGGDVIPGVHGAGGEIGHMVLNVRETVPCNCGKCGCVEQYCSATGIVRIAKGVLESSDAPSCLRGDENLTCKDIFDAGKAGDTLALEILEIVYDYMGQFLANLCSAIDPEAVVIGGGVSRAGEPLLEGAKRYFHKYVFHAARDVRFSLATLGNDAGAYGAFKLALNAFGK